MAFTEKDIFDYSHQINGLIVETFSGFETMINIIISNYYCIDEKKIDDLTAIIQELRINHRIDILFDDVMKDICPEIINEKQQFKYLKNSNNNELVKDIKSAIISYKELRNLFSHYTTKMPSKEELKLSKIYFRLEKFYPKNKKGERVPNATKYVLEFNQDDFLLLRNDAQILSGIFSRIYFKARTHSL